MDEDSISMKDLFVEPQRGFWLRKRKRRNSDAVSVCSLDVSVASEPENKRKRGLSKVASLANLLSTPMKPMMKIGASLQRSFTGGRADSPSTSTSPMTSSPRNFLRRSCSILRTPSSLAQQVATPPRAKQRLTRSWSQAIARNNTKEFSAQQVKRQEAIYELWSGEDGLVEDLEFVQAMYKNALIQLHMLTEEEARCIFGELDDLINVHRFLRDNLADLRDSAGVTECVGKTLLNWVPKLKCYVSHCSNQVWARALLEEKKRGNRRFQEFLKRSRESSCSRKLDLWSFLDAPRSRLMKYPLLVGEILRHTPSNHEDVVSLTQVATTLTAMLQQTDIATAAAECRLVRSRLHFPHSHPSAQLVDNATTVTCSGALKDTHGMKFHCFLFNTCFVVTRVCRSSPKFTVSFPVIPVEELEAEEVELVPKNTGAQKTCPGRPAFRVRFNDNDRIFVTSDEHALKHWIDCFRQVVPSISSQENMKPAEMKKNETLKPGRYQNSENDSQFVRPFRQRNRISKTDNAENLV
ncbi:rho guanine nucleotide exchange factor 3-like isoform X2 [Periplaneta americana]